MNIASTCQPITRAYLSHARRGVELKPGDWIVLDPTLPSRIEMRSRFKQLIVEAPRTAWSEPQRNEMTKQARNAEDPTALPALTTAVQL